MGSKDDEMLTIAVSEARQGLAEGGVPIGSALFVEGQCIGRGHNRRVQMGSATRHAEIDCLENAGRLAAAVYARSTLVTTLSPCDMCTGAILLYKIKRVLIGENDNFMGGEATLREHGVEVVVARDAACIAMMRDFIASHPTVWNEDIGV